MLCLWLLGAQKLFKRPESNETKHDFNCKKCRDKVSNVTILNIDLVDINGEEIKKVRSFCYLSDFTGQRGGCFSVTTARIRPAWKKFRELS